MSVPDRIEARFRGRLGAFALDAAFTIPAHGVTAIFGPSGCGKTSVLRCMAGLQQVEDGYCAVNGDVWQEGSRFRPPHERQIGYVFQEASLFPHLSVRRNMLFGAPRYGNGGDGPSPTFDEVVTLLGLDGLVDRSPHRLSGGERQRVAIARALLSQPRLLLMDEPLSALDRATKDEILPFLERLHRNLSLPILYVSHDMSEVERLADQIVLMKSGRVLAVGPLAEVQNDPTLPLARARDASVTLDGRIESYDADFGLLRVAVRGGHFFAPARAARIGAMCRLRVVAGDVSLSIAPPGPSTILNSLTAVIASATLLDSNEVIVGLTLGEGGAGDRMLARITRQSWDRLGFAPGMQVHAQVKGVALAPGRSGPE
jgi:molybdate transport system ATP-binding protein